MTGVAVLGSTGSIGRATLDVLAHLGTGYRVTALAAGRDVRRLADQTRRFRPRRVFLADDRRRARLRLPRGTRVVSGPGALARIVRAPDTRTVVVALTGSHGIDACLAALGLGKRVCLATKEILVAYGPFVTRAARRGRGELIPVDSEHSAIHQCLVGQPHEVRRIILTASGGPFLNRSSLRRVRYADALRHPVWRMGRKITVDSATLMNKGLEVIEAHQLFGVPLDRIEVVIHPQSVIHSLVEFTDGAMLGQLSRPDMRLAIQYALTFPARRPALVAPLDLVRTRCLDFATPDRRRFPCLDLAYRAAGHGSTFPAVLAAADEVCVDFFAAGRIAFAEIPVLIRAALDAHRPPAVLTPAAVGRAEQWARDFVAGQVS